ncbi:MAG: hypothetical protein ACJAU6_000508 [Alphaproteobacteria bacterium]|jgi:hypothetical protein
MAVVVLAVGVLGCEGAFLNENTASSIESPWNGRWVGRYESSLGLFSCPARGTLEFHLVAGKMTGRAAADGATHEVEGRINGAGVIHNGFLKDGARTVATLTGTFGAKTAAGRWVGEICEGVWTVWRFKQPV